MCVLCDGGTVEELFAQYRERIAEHGFTMVAVGSGPKSWVYTIGLLENFSHPEFVVTGIAAESAAGVITGLVERVRNGEFFDASSRETTYRTRPVRFGSVHFTQWVHGRFNEWLNYYGWLGERPPSPEAVQILWANDLDIFPPDRDFCHDHRNCQPLLSAPAAHDVNEVARRQRRPTKRRR